MENGFKWAKKTSRKTKLRTISPDGEMVIRIRVDTIEMYQQD